ncbi:MAG: glutamate racemase [Clostridia bacterium]|nr:glutamate racemase [Clostridia bacterium]
MLGIFDSGLGGLAVLQEIRKHDNNADIVFFADTKNAPYGTKSRGELISLVKRDIRILKDAGANRILIGCCTASTVYKYLTKDEQKISVPIIAPTAKAAARETKNGKIGVIATEATVASNAFYNQIKKENRRAKIYQLPTQILVSLIEGGLCDNLISSRDFLTVYKLLKPLKDEGIDTIVLGCTHFSYLKRTIEECLRGVRVISSGECGARAILNGSCSAVGNCKTVFL